MRATWVLVAVPCPRSMISDGMTFTTCSAPYRVTNSENHRRMNSGPPIGYPIGMRCNWRLMIHISPSAMLWPLCIMPLTSINTSPIAVRVESDGWMVRANAHGLEFVATTTNTSPRFDWVSFMFYFASTCVCVCVCVCVFLIYLTDIDLCLPSSPLQNQ